jgi:polar amino acid transport system substrate-binding protein
MKKWKSLLMALGAALVMAAQGVAHAQSSSSGYWQAVQKSGVLRCGVANAPPYVIRDPKTGQYSGIFVDLCREFGEQELGVKVQMVETSWDNIVAGLQSNRWDLALALNRTPKRALAIAYSGPVWNYEITGVYDKANPKFKTPPKSLADIDRAGTTIGVMTGTAADQLLTARVKNAGILRLSDVDTTHLALSSRRADVLFDDDETNAPFAATNPKRWGDLHPVPALAKQGIGFGLRRDATEADLQVLDIFIDNKAAVGDIAALGSVYIDHTSSNTAK